MTDYRTDDDRVKVGTGWDVWGYHQDVVAERWDPIFVGGAAIRERVVRLRLRRKGARDHYHWIPASRVGRYGVLSEPGIVNGPRSTREERVEAAVEQARTEAEVEAKRKPLTPQRRLRNRITSARYRLNHPEKHGRTKWSALEAKQIQDEMNAAAEEIEKLKVAS